LEQGTAFLAQVGQPTASELVGKVLEAGMAYPELVELPVARVSLVLVSERPPGSKASVEIQTDLVSRDTVLLLVPGLVSTVQVGRPALASTGRAGQQAESVDRSLARVQATASLPRPEPPVASALKELVAPRVEVALVSRALVV
jgi:hypothetical protein